jgi:hypothetical protein
MKMRNKYMSFGIDSIIQANLEMQTTQRELTKFGFKNFSLKLLENSNFLNRYNSWDEDKRSSFLKLIGGTVNFKKTKFFVESLPLKYGENK